MNNNLYGTLLLPGWNTKAVAASTESQVQDAFDVENNTRFDDLEVIAWRLKYASGLDAALLDINTSSSAVDVLHSPTDVCLVGTSKSDSRIVRNVLAQPMPLKKGDRWTFRLGHTSNIAVRAVSVLLECRYKIQK